MVSYARRYYARLPKVALGHWPPVFHVIQAIWYGLFGVSPLSAMLLMSAIGATFLAGLFFMLKSRFGIFASTVSTASVFCSPVFQAGTEAFMASLLTSTLCLMAANWYARFIEHPSTVNALWFAFTQHPWLS